MCQQCNDESSEGYKLARALKQALDACAALHVNPATHGVWMHYGPHIYSQPVRDALTDYQNALEAYNQFHENAVYRLLKELEPEKAVPVGH